MTAQNTIVNPSGNAAYKALPRFFVQPGEVPQVPGAIVSIENVEMVHQAKSVLRMAPGDTLIVVCAQTGTLIHAKVVELQKKSLVVEWLATLPNTHQPLPAITLGAGILKGQRWDWLLQKATELGVNTLVPLATRYTVVKVEDGSKKQTRWQAIAREAAEQCEGLFIPQVNAPQSIRDFMDGLPADSVKLLLLERGEERTPLNRVLSKLSGLPAITVAIGPEGGWHDDEVDAFLAAGFQAVSFGDRILRSETAAMAFLAAVLYAWDGRSDLDR